MFRRIGEWILLLIRFMVIMPILWAFQGICTPFELVFNLIRYKGKYTPKDYTIAFYQNVKENFFEKLLENYDICDDNDAYDYFNERYSEREES